MPRAIGNGQYLAANGRVYSGRSEAIRVERQNRRGPTANAMRKRRQRLRKRRGS